MVPAWCGGFSNIDTTVRNRLVQSAVRKTDVQKTQYTTTVSIEKKSVIDRLLTVLGMEHLQRFAGRGPDLCNMHYCDGATPSTRFDHCDVVNAHKCRQAVILSSPLHLRALLGTADGSPADDSRPSFIPCMSQPLTDPFCTRTLRNKCS
jgi:hypothetical protein